MTSVSEILQSSRRRRKELTDLILLSVKRLRIYQLIAGYIPLARASISVTLRIIPLHVVSMFPGTHQ